MRLRCKLLSTPTLKPMAMIRGGLQSTEDMSTPPHPDG